MGFLDRFIPGRIKAKDTASTPAIPAHYTETQEQRAERERQFSRLRSPQPLDVNKEIDRWKTTVAGNRSLKDSAPQNPVYVTEQVGGLLVRKKVKSSSRTVDDPLTNLKNIAEIANRTQHNARRQLPEGQSGFGITYKKRVGNQIVEQPMDQEGLSRLLRQVEKPKVQVEFQGGLVVRKEPTVLGVNEHLTSGKMLVFEDDNEVVITRRHSLKH